MSGLSPDLGPISPELALVDPVLAAAARELLPPPGEFRPRSSDEPIAPERTAAPVESPPVVPAPEPVPVAVEPEPTPPRRRRGRRTAKVMVLAVAAAVVFVLGYVVGDRTSSSSSGTELAARTDALSEASRASATDVHGPLRRPASSAAPTTQTLAPTTATVAPRKTTTQASKPPPSPPPRRTTTAPKRTTTTTTTKPKPKPAQTVTKPKPPAASGFVPARTWTWAPVAGATAYRVTFTRGASPFYRATTRAARLDLPASVKFVPGKYTWSVVPVVNGRPAAEVVHSSFTVG